MQTRTLGRDLRVSAQGLGCMGGERGEFLGDRVVAGGRYPDMSTVNR